MKKLRTAICATLSIACLFGSAGCIHFHKDPPKSIVIDGEKYVSGFYDGLLTTEHRYLGNTPCSFRTDDSYEWWSYDDTAYKLYCCEHEDSMVWSPDIYCKESQFDEVKAYYQSAESFDYYFSTGNGKDNKVKIPDTESKEVLNEIVEYFVKKSKNSKYDPFANSGYTTVKYDLETWDYIQVKPFKISVDGIFVTTHGKGFYYSDDQLYALKGSSGISGAFGADNTKTFYLLEGEKYEYLLSLFKSIALPEILAAKEDKDSVLK